MHGKGELIYIDGRRYVGEYKNNLRDGKGTFVTKEGRNEHEYNGWWQNNNRHGYGV